MRVSSINTAARTNCGLEQTAALHSPSTAVAAAAACVRGVRETCVMWQRRRHTSKEPPLVPLQHQLPNGGERLLGFGYNFMMRLSGKREGLGGLSHQA